MVKQLHENNHIIAVWVVDETELALHLAKLGVDTLITDKPREIMRTLGIETKKNMATELPEVVELLEEVLKIQWTFY